MDETGNHQPDAPKQKEEPDIEISVATPEDERAIWDVQYRSSLAFLPDAEKGISEDDVKSWYSDFADDGSLTVAGDKKLADEIKRLKENPPTDSRAFVAKAEGKTVGFCTVKRELDQNRLVGIYLLPGLRGKGLGERLWNEGQKFLDETKDTKVALFEHNKIAEKFYTRLGFERTEGSRPGAKTKSGVETQVIEMILKRNK